MADDKSHFGIGARAIVLLCQIYHSVNSYSNWIFDAFVSVALWQLL